MKTILRNKLATGEIEDITIFESELTRWLDDNGAAANAISKICADVPKNSVTDLEEERIRNTMLNYLDRGYKLGNVTQRCIMLTASDGRKATSTWVDEKHVPGLGAWMYCGLKPKDVTLAVNKFMAYLGLLASASKLFSDVFDTNIDVRRIAVIKDGYVDVEGIVDFTDENGVAHDVVRKCHINAFDGFGIINKDKTNGKSQTLRLPWEKIFSQAMSWKAIHQFCEKRGIEPKFVDFWGNTLNIDDYDVIITESCFKAAKLYENYEQYADAFEKLGHNVCVCVQEHAPKAKGMPYQQGQTLTGNEQDAQEFVDYSKDIMAKFKNRNEAIELLTSWQKRVARVYPALLREMNTARTIQEKYDSKLVDMLGGRIPELGYNAFLAPDPVAFVEHLFGLPINGYLKAGECYCSNCKPGEVDVTRNPHLDNAHVVLNNVERCPLAIGPTFFINIFDMTTIRLRADYDGDHVWYSQNEMLLKLVHKTYEVLNNLPIDWDAPSAQKVHITRGAIAEFVANLLHGSEIGLYADALTKMWNTRYDRDVCAWLTYAGNVLIDAAKHGSVKIEQPDAVKALNNVSLPLFAMYAKADDARPVGDYWLKERVTKKGKVLPPRCKYSGSFLDMYSKKIDEQVPKTLEVNDLEDLIFNPNMLLIDPQRKYGRLTGLSCKAKYFNQETGEYEGGGVFQRIAFRRAAEWKKLHDTPEFVMNHEEWEETKKQMAIKEMVAWAREQYADYPKAQEASDDTILEAVYDIVTRNVFNTVKVSDGYDTAVKAAYWNIFGEMAFNTICQNIGEDVLLSDVLLEDDFDID